LFKNFFISFSFVPPTHGARLPVTYSGTQ